MPINILYVQHDSGISGSTISLRNLLAALDRTKIVPCVALYSNGPAKKLYESLGIPVDIVPARSFGTCPGPSCKELGYYINLLALLPNKSWDTYLKEKRPGIVHLNDKACLQAGISAHKVRIPIVWHLRSSYFSSRSKLQARISRCIILKCASKLIAISEDEIDGFEDHPGLQIIQNSVDLEKAEEAKKKRDLIRSEFGISEDEIAIATITSTINEVRGTWDFIRSAGLVHRQFPSSKLKFFIVARIPPKEDRKSAIVKFPGKDRIHPLDQAELLKEENDLEGCLTLTGYRDDPLAVMAGMDIVVVCNRHGVLGRMPFEAMSVGTPVVATAGHSGRSSIVIDGVTGLIAQPKNPESISDNIIRLITDTGLRSKLIEQGQLHTNLNFDPQKNARKIENIYEEIFNSNILGRQKSILGKNK